MKPMKRSTTHNRVFMLIEGAKNRQGWTDEKLAKHLGMATSTLRNKRCQYRLCDLPLSTIEAIASYAGFELEFKERS